MTARVLMLTHQCAGRGGSFMRAVSLARPLVSLGYDMTLLASRATPGARTRHSDWHGVHVVEMPDILPWRLRNAGLSPVDLLARLSFARGGAFDLFHTFDHRPCASFPALWRARKATPFVSDWADLWGKSGLGSYREGFLENILARMDDRLEPYVRRQSHAVTAISSELRKRAIQLGIPERHVPLVPAGSNSDLILPMDKDEARSKYGIPSSAAVLVCAGFSSLDAKLLVDTFLELLKGSGDIRLIMTGAHIPGIDAAFEHAGASGHVHHFGIQPYEKLGEILACGDIMWLPYGEAPVDASRFPNRFGEYIATGRPIATNRGGDHAVVVEQERIGVASPPEAAASARDIQALLKDSFLCAEMGKRARQLATTRFAWATIAKTVAGLYQDLLS